LGLALPDVVEPAGAYEPAVRTGSYVYTSGQVPLRDGALVAVGKLGETVSVERGRECARQCALNALAAMRVELGELSAVSRVVKALVLVASSADFVDQPRVADGASELLRQVFGEAGRHARSAASVVALPLDAPVELELVVATS
jgi:enamine deaminase RidA (YjgF/YER057c/UK114 family)